MKLTIIPDYIRYTYFTLPMRIVLAELAEKRNLYTVRFKLAEVQYKQAMAGNGPLWECDLYYKRMQDYLEVVEEIDQAIHEIYYLHGRLN